MRERARKGGLGGVGVHGDLTAVVFKGGVYNVQAHAAAFAVGGNARVKDACGNAGRNHGAVVADGEGKSVQVFVQGDGQLLLRGVEKLKNLFRGNRSRSEVVATFLSILELCKTGSVTLEGDISGENPDVRLIKNDNPEGGNINGSN